MRNLKFFCVLLACVLIIFVSPLLSQQRGPQPQPPAAAKAGTEANLLPDQPSMTQHTLTIEGQSVAYTAEAGWLPIRDEGKLSAKIFYVYYKRDGVQDLSKRPLIFSFNGGPGTASVWMHLGYTGPRRVLYDDEGIAMRPPIGLEDNPHSILDVADIVYLDAIGTGFSRMVEGEDLHKYHGTLSDIQSVAEFVRLFLVKQNRWMSPKFVIGESYGTTRASGLAGYLSSHNNIYLNGVILVSTTNLSMDRGPDVSYATTLPQRAATAYYHHRLSKEFQSRPLRKFLDEVENFALGDYLTALVKGDRLETAERERIAKQVAQYTGLKPQYVLSTNLRIDAQRFWKELMRDDRLTVGRLDSRYIGIDRDAAGEGPESDPAMANWNGPFTNAVNRYLREELHFSPDLEYFVWGNVRPWQQDPGTNVSDMLRQAMRDNPYLKVMVQGGYFDAGCDYFSAMYTLSHIQPGGEFRNRIRFAWYESGHMMYLRKPDLANANNDLRAFIKSCLEDPVNFPRRLP